jgi:type II secretion system protein C
LSAATEGLRVAKVIMEDQRTSHNVGRRHLLLGLLSIIGVLSIGAGLWRVSASRTDNGSHVAEASAAKGVSSFPSAPKAGRMVPATVSPMGRYSSVSAKPVPLILVSVSLGRTIRDGSAKIGVVRDSPQTYLAGAVLENGAQLVEIHPDYVVLLKNGSRARLYLDDKSTLRRSDEAAEPTVGGNQQLAPPVRLTSREAVTDYIRPSPAYDGASLVGYQVYPGARPAAFHQMGLQAGDLIIEINGTPLTDPSTAWEIFRGLMQGSTFAASVTRNGAIVHISLDGSLLVSADDAIANGSSQAMLNRTAQ